jgi:ribosome assembly protein YihI (activator of Der GTPase)
MSRITFQKRQKEMKRQEKQRAKAERRAQKKLAKRAGLAAGSDDRATPSPWDDISSEQGSG